MQEKQRIYPTETGNYKHTKKVCFRPKSLIQFLNCKIVFSNIYSIYVIRIFIEQ
jgi:hypothetical protein